MLTVQYGTSQISLLHVCRAYSCLSPGHTARELFPFYSVLPVLSLICLFSLATYVGYLSASKYAVCSPQQQDDSLEKVIKDTESLFKSREKEYQETIDQIEVQEGGRVGNGGVGSCRREKPTVSAVVWLAVGWQPQIWLCPMLCTAVCFRLISTLLSFGSWSWPRPRMI